jgi:beta-ketodecanoyl-[acyl-carrier-protein] synthase
VAAFNAFARRFNEQNAATIAGTVAAVAGSSANLLEKTYGIMRCYVIDKALIRGAFRGGEGRTSCTE